MNTLTIDTPMSPAFGIILFRIRLWVFKATFKVILAISWRLVLLVEEIGVLKKIQLPVTSQIVTDKIQNVEFATCLIEFATKVVIGKTKQNKQSPLKKVKTVMVNNSTNIKNEHSPLFLIEQTLENTEGSIKNGQSR